MLLHGGVQSVDLTFAGLIPELVGRHRVIGVELQGHGRTADIDRVSTPAALAGDVVALLDHLGIDRAHVLGFSLGAAVTLELAVSHPERVRSIVPISEPVRPDGMHEDLRDPSMHATFTRMPTAQDFADMQEAYARLSPHPEHFAEFMAAQAQNAADLQGWSDEQPGRDHRAGAVGHRRPRLRDRRARGADEGADPRLAAGRAAGHHAHDRHQTA